MYPGHSKSENGFFWFLLWYFNWHIKFLIYFSFVFLTIPPCGCRLSTERMYQRELVETNAMHTLSACSSGTIWFRTEGAGCRAWEQFSEGLWDTQKNPLKFSCSVFSRSTAVFSLLSHPRTRHVLDLFFKAERDPS